MSELRLHTNRAVNPKTSKYYLSRLYHWKSDYAHFLAASLDSMMQVFYIELDGFIGGYWNELKGRVEPRNNEQGSLTEYLFDGTRQARKKTAQARFEQLLYDHKEKLAQIHDLRGKLAHFKKYSERNGVLAPGYAAVREILDGLAEVIYLLGFQRWNMPDYIEKDSEYSKAVHTVVDRLISDFEGHEKMRMAFNKSRDEWFSD